jgi:2-oxoglutarate dehydrogenase E1 component
MGKRSGFSLFNEAYAAELYERFLGDPESVDAASRAILEKWSPPEAKPAPHPAAILPGVPCIKIVGAANYMDSIRKFGYMEARIDPLSSTPPGDPSLFIETHGISEADLRSLPANVLTGPISQEKNNGLEVARALRAVYCSSIGYDYAHLRGPEERLWLLQAAESGCFRAPANPVDALSLLERLTEVETFSRFLVHSFPGKSIFSCEGLDMLIPILDTVIGAAVEIGVRNVLVGMAHRGRVSVLAHILKKPYAQILAEFQDPMRGRNFHDDLGWIGDVKYHLGGKHSINDTNQIELVITIPPNPSHLEAIDPVLEGMARAAGTDAGRPGAPSFDPAYTLPILIHGDASFIGQGVVAETLNFERLPGYSTGGTVHIIANNQLGFTAVRQESCSALFASDLARGFKIPLVHVNADDPEACIEVARLAHAYRSRFRRDFLIDLVGYRRYGHNEGDEPRFTQPIMYQTIDRHPSVREIWAQSLAERGEIAPGEADQLVSKHQAVLQQIWENLSPEEDLAEITPHRDAAGAPRKTVTAVSMERIHALNLSLLELPHGFALDAKLVRARERRRHALEDPDARSISWPMAEELAFASILQDGTPIRLTGQDAERGTFSQRHCVLHDRIAGRTYTPLQSLVQARASFEVHNSPLTENAAIAFEYGYSVQAPSRLVLWEAQYGDFVNGGQTAVDEFVLSSRAKWGISSSLVLLLPHGFEGQGPDHSSARPERLLQLASEVNFRIANCTTAAQYFHLLRRQAGLLKTDPLPMVILTPKSLLRNPLVASSLRDLAEGEWQRVIPDAQPNSEVVERLILCSGKIYADLAGDARRRENPWIAICRLEQLYPFPYEEIRAVLESYPKLREVLWVQEEPENMGAWDFLRPLLRGLIQNRWPLRYVGRNRSSSPAEGSGARHASNQMGIVNQAFSPDLQLGQQDMVLTGKLQP